MRFQSQSIRGRCAWLLGLLLPVLTPLAPAADYTPDVTFTLDVPGRCMLVDHALSRAKKGLAGFLHAEGEENPEIFRKGR